MTSRRLLHHTIFLKRDLYHLGSRKLKTQILDELERDFRKPRNSLKRLFRRLKDRKALETFERRSGRPREFDDQTIWWLQTLYLQMDQMNSKSMQQAMPEWLKKHDDPALDEMTRFKLLKMCHSTIDRLLKKFKKQLEKKKRSGTKRGHIRLYKDRVPLHRFEDKITKPGNIEMDTVAHCGGSLMGQFIWTLNCTDVYSGWCEQRAVWHKMQNKVLEAAKDILITLPFQTLSIHTDNGFEFINEYFISHFEEQRRLGSPIVQTRSRAYHKNDHAHIEQKNSTHVRRLLGHERLDNPDLIELINNLYQNEHSQFMNFFVPQRKLIEKIRTGNKTIKRYDKPKTPYQRLLDSNAISVLTKEKLRTVYANLNPFDLNKTIQNKVKEIEKALNQKQRSSDDESTPQAA
jgi:hypothetical protein